MSDQDASRKLTTIFYADVVGYSRLTGEDELGTHKRVMGALDDAAKRVRLGDGSVLRYAGDAILAEFPSVVAAVKVAADIQQTLSRKNVDVEQRKQIQLRIGVNLGEVIQDRNEIYGEGVNIAARLESTAAPGGICISSVVHDQVKGKVDMGFQDGGLETLKHIDRPIQVYHWHPNSVPVIPTQLRALPTVPEKPSIAVLAFTNMSGDPEQEYFSDGITEDIITELSRFSGLFVIARNSSFAFKHQSVDVKQAARELGVRYMLEGSVRRAGNRLRITAQLLDTEKATHIWAERYDGDLDDVFDLQDEITRNIVGSIAPQIEIAEVERSRRLPAADLTSYELSLKAQAIFYDNARGGNPDLREDTVEAAQAALDLDPRNPLALWLQAYSYCMQYLYRSSPDPDESLARAWDIAGRFLQADSSNPRAYMIRAMIYTFRGEFDAAIADYRRAFSLNPNFAMNAMMMAWGESLAGMTTEAKEHAELALRLSPRDQDLWLGDTYLAMLQACFAEGDFEEAKKWGQLAVQMTPKAPIRRALMIASCTYTDDPEGAAHHAHELAMFAPDFVPTILSGSMTLYKMPEHNSLLVKGLRKAGL